MKIELADDDFASIAEAAAREHVTPEEWIAQQIVRCAPSEKRRQESMKRLLEIINQVDGDFGGSDNDAVDRDLAREYGSDHSDAA